MMLKVNIDGINNQMDDLQAFIITQLNFAHPNETIYNTIELLSQGCV